jgi:GTP pyrophosphokinase
VIDVDLLAKAFRLAASHHARQQRKGSGTPYLGHLLGVTDLVFLFGGTDVEAAAALLHDAVEDGGGAAVLDDVRNVCGSEVAEIVAACSDSLVDTTGGAPKEAWLPRKRHYIEHLGEPGAAKGALLVSACDKLHNLSSTRIYYETEGEDVWGRFTNGWVGQVWYYRSLLAVYEEGADPRAARVARRLGVELRLLEAELLRRGHDLSDLEDRLLVMSSREERGC